MKVYINETKERYSMNSVENYTHVLKIYNDIDDFFN